MIFTEPPYVLDFHTNPLN